LIVFAVTLWLELTLQGLERQKHRFFSDGYNWQFGVCSIMSRLNILTQAQKPQGGTNTLDTGDTQGYRFSNWRPDHNARSSGLERPRLRYIDPRELRL